MKQAGFQETPRLREGRGELEKRGELAQGCDSTGEANDAFIDGKVLSSCRSNIGRSNHGCRMAQDEADNFAPRSVGGCRVTGVTTPTAPE
jgi:hypothetical protein